MAALSFSGQDLAAFEEVAVIHDRTKFLPCCRILSPGRWRKQWRRPGRIPLGADVQPASARPSASAERISKPNNLTVAQFATLAGKSRQQIYKDIGSRRLLALSVGARGQHIPDWQIDEIKKKLTQGLLEAAQGVDEWTLYYALFDPNRDFAGKSPIETVTPGNLKRTLGTILNQLGFHD